MVIAMLLVMVSVVMCERVAPEMLYQGIEYGGRALVHQPRIRPEDTSERTDQTPKDMLSWQKPETNQFPICGR